MAEQFDHQVHFARRPCKTCAFGILNFENSKFTLDIVQIAVDSTGYQIHRSTAIFITAA